MLTLTKAQHLLIPSRSAPLNYPLENAALAHSRRAWLSRSVLMLLAGLAA
jgi:hypothetical protein